MPHPSARLRSGAGLRVAPCWPALTLAALLACPLASRAQERPAERPIAGLPEALNAGAAVPPVTHTSAFLRYRRLGDTPVGSWRDANDTVTRIGGWRVYTREAHAPEAPAAAGSAPAAVSAPASSAGHGHGHHGPASPAGARP
ncbi:MAG: hypothetical protein Q8K45_04190 [Rubrivivax sp.]|nr:hypothetical protein [Rubrivivax sp.]